MSDADANCMAALEGRLAHLEGRVASLEAWRREAEEAVRAFPEAMRRAFGLPAVAPKESGGD